MPDEVKNEQMVETPVVEEKQPEVMLTSEETKDELELPEDATDRTREQFEKLKQKNRELAEQLRQKETPSNIPESVYADLTPKVTLPPQVANLPQNELDKLMDDQGYIDPALLKKYLADANTQAQQAILETKRLREEMEKAKETDQVRKAHKQYPQLDPKNTAFNPKFFDAVKNEMVSQMIRGEKDLVAAAEKVSQWFPVTAPKAEEKEKKEMQIKQANMTGTTQSRPQENKPGNTDLVSRMWKGDKNATIERLKRAGL